MTRAKAVLIKGHFPCGPISQALLSSGHVLAAPRDSPGPASQAVEASQGLMVYKTSVNGTPQPHLRMFCIEMSGLLDTFMTMPNFV